MELTYAEGKNPGSRSVRFSSILLMKYKKNSPSVDKSQANVYIYP